MGDGWSLVAAEPDPTTAGVVLVFEHADERRVPFEILVTPRAGVRPVAATTGLFEISCRNSDDTTTEEDTSELVQKVLLAIEDNERNGPVHPQGWPSGVRLPPGPALFLIPGHLGDPLDLSRRSVMLLARIPIVFVERDHAEETRSLLGELGISAAGKTVVEVPAPGTLDQEARECLRRMREECLLGCLFGVAEGTPGFCDLGSEVVREAERMGVPVHSIGGPSALSLALMRLGRDLREFTFLGRVEDATDVARVRRILRSGIRLPIVVFVDGRGCRDLLPRIMSPHRWARGWIVSELTTPAESLHLLEGGRPSLPDRSALPDDARVVVILEPAEALIDDVRGRLARGIRSLFDARSGFSRSSR